MSRLRSGALPSMLASAAPATRRSQLLRVPALPAWARGVAGPRRHVYGAAAAAAEAHAAWAASREDEEERSEAMRQQRQARVTSSGSASGKRPEAGIARAAPAEGFFSRAQHAVPVAAALPASAATDRNSDVGDAADQFAAPACASLAAAQNPAALAEGASAPARSAAAASIVAEHSASVTRTASTSASSSRSATRIIPPAEQLLSSLLVPHELDAFLEEAHLSIAHAEYPLSTLLDRLLASLHARAELPWQERDASADAEELSLLLLAHYLPPSTPQQIASPRVCLRTAHALYAVSAPLAAPRAAPHFAALVALRRRVLYLYAAHQLAGPPRAVVRACSALTDERLGKSQARYLVRKALDNAARLPPHSLPRRQALENLTSSAQTLLARGVLHVHALESAGLREDETKTTQQHAGTQPRTDARELHALLRLLARSQLPDAVLRLARSAAHVSQLADHDAAADGPSAVIPAQAGPSWARCEVVEQTLHLLVQHSNGRAALELLHLVPRAKRTLEMYLPLLTRWSECAPRLRLESSGAAVEHAQSGDQAAIPGAVRLRRARRTTPLCAVRDRERRARAHTSFELWNELLVSWDGALPGASGMLQPQVEAQQQQQQALVAVFAARMLSHARAHRPGLVIADLAALRKLGLLAAAHDAPPRSEAPGALPLGHLLPLSAQLAALQAFLHAGRYRTARALCARLLSTSDAAALQAREGSHLSMRGTALLNTMLRGALALAMPLDKRMTRRSRVAAARNGHSRPLRAFASAAPALRRRALKPRLRGRSGEKRKRGQTSAPEGPFGLPPTSDSVAVLPPVRRWRPAHAASPHLFWFRALERAESVLRLFAAHGVRPDDVTANVVLLLLVRKARSAAEVHGLAKLALGERGGDISAATTLPRSAGDEEEEKTMQRDARARVAAARTLLRRLQIPLPRSASSPPPASSQQPQLSRAEARRRYEKLQRPLLGAVARRLYECGDGAAGRIAVRRYVEMREGLRRGREREMGA